MTLDDLMKRILNDPNIFYVYHTIFNEIEWQDLREKHLHDRSAYVIDKIDQKIESLREELNFQSYKRRRILQDAIKSAEALKDAVYNKPYILARIFVFLNKFGLIKCNLPNMEDYGKVIENYSSTTVEQYFFSKIERSSGYQKRALRKTLEYVKELYAMNFDVLEIAFFVRKLNSLTEFVEAIKDE
jgi:hypothetical protein